MAWRRFPLGSVITINFQATDAAQAATASEFSGLDAVNALDRVAFTDSDSERNSTNSFAFSSLTKTTREANELLVGAIGVRGQVDTSLPSTSTYDLGFTSGTGYTVMPGNGSILSGNQGNKNSSIHPEYQIVDAIGQYEATGTLSDNAAGPWATIIATYRTDAATNFLLQAIPDNTVDAGEVFGLRVTARKADNSTATGFTGTVHFSIVDPISGEFVPADYTFTVADAGVHTFTSSTKLIKTGANAHRKRQPV